MSRPTLDGWREIGWSDIARGAVGSPGTISYWLPLVRRAEELPVGPAQSAAHLMARVQSLVLSEDSGSRPLTHCLEGPSGRSFATEDLSDDDLDFIDLVAGEHDSDADLKARLYDVLWFRRKSRADYAQAAIDNYKRSAQNLRASHPVPAFARIGRALALAKLTKARSAETILMWIWASLDEAHPHWVLRCLRVLADHRSQPLQVLATRAEECAEAGDTKGTGHLARSLYGLAAKLWQSANEQERARQALAMVARGHEAEAMAADGDNHFVKAHLLAEAVRAWRDAGHPMEADRLHAVLLQTQQEAAERIVPIRLGEVDFTADARRAMEAVKTENALQAFFQLATLVEPPDPGRWAARFASESENSLVRRLFGQVTIDERGRTVRLVPAADDPEGREPALASYVHEKARWERECQVVAALNPARLQIASDHPALTETLREVVENSPFVPGGHDESVLRTLRAGFEGDWLVVAHFAPPQIEACLRWLLEQRGVRVSSLRSDGTQRDSLLKSLLDHPECTAAVGTELKHALAGILIEHGTTNLRNRMAHGIASDEHLQGPETLYLWWILLRMCVLLAVLKAEDAARAHAYRKLLHEVSGKAESLQHFIGGLFPVERGWGVRPVANREAVVFVSNRGRLREVTVKLVRSSEGMPMVHAFREENGSCVSGTVARGVGDLGSWLEKQLDWPPSA